MNSNAIRFIQIVLMGTLIGVTLSLVTEGNLAIFLFLAISSFLFFLLTLLDRFKAGGKQ
jgi:hypothetical protein